MQLEPKVRARYAASAARVEGLRRNGQPIEAPGVLDANGSWFIQLFKRDFTIAVESGRIEKLKLRCKGGFVLFGYEPSLSYPAELPGCSLQVLGAAGTHFILTQY